jgi:hypothetical protein
MNEHIWKTEVVWARADGKHFSRRVYTGKSGKSAMAAAVAAEAARDETYLFTDVTYTSVRGDTLYGRLRDGVWGNR